MAQLLRRAPLFCGPSTDNAESYVDSTYVVTVKTCGKQRSGNALHRNEAMGSNGTGFADLFLDLFANPETLEE